VAIKRWKIVISLLVLLGTVTLAAAGGLLINRLLNDSFFAYRPPPTPSQLKQARVVIGDWFLTRSRFVETGESFLEQAQQGHDNGSINDIAIRTLYPPGPRIIIAGRFGAMIVDRNGLRQSQVKYDFETKQTKLGPFRITKPASSIGDIEIVDVDGDGGYEYLARGSFDGAALFDQQGRRLWCYHKRDNESISLENVTVGDLHGDGHAEFIVSSNGIEAFNKNGVQLWRRPAESSPSQIEVVDADGTGKKNIISIENKLEIRDEAGNKIRSVDCPAGQVGKFSLSTNPNNKRSTILVIKDGYLWLIDLDGRVVAKFDAPLSEFPDVIEKSPYGEFGTSAFKVKGVWAKLVKNQPEYLAAVAEFLALDRSVLYVYTSSGKLVYQEVLPEECLSIAVLPPEQETDNQEFLVGGSRTVWRYKAK
jgi:hypothetical protein